MNTASATLLTDFGKYFERFPDDKCIDMSKFLPLFYSWHPTLKDDQRNTYEQLILKTREDVTEDDKDTILRDLLSIRLSTEMANLSVQYEEGEIDNLPAALEEVMHAFKRDAKFKGIDFIRDDVGDLLHEDAIDTGLQPRLECLRRSMRPLRGGDFMVIAGRPDKGKTTLVASEVAFMAPQLPGTRTAVWLNNEGPGRKIKQRLYQAALGMKLSEMIALHREGKMHDMYDQIMGMQDRVRVFDVHGMDTFGVQHILDSHDAGLVVYDMIDNVKGFGNAARTDLMLEQMYQWARELCVSYDCVGIATSQISNEGDGELAPTLGMLKDSKTGKQGACDVQLMIGASNDPTMARVRQINLVKNKLHREGAASDPREIVAYCPEIARYEDATLETPEKELPDGNNR